MKDPTKKNKTNMEVFLLRSDLGKMACFYSTYVVGRGEK